MKFWIASLALLSITLPMVACSQEAAVPGGNVLVTTVSVAEPAAPPVWAQEMIMAVERVPVVGPVLSKILLYLGIVSALLTSAVAFLLGSLSILSKAFAYAGLAKAAELIQALQRSRFIYLLKYISMFNAKKVQPS